MLTKRNSLADRDWKPHNKSCAEEEERIILPFALIKLLSRTRIATAVQLI